MKSAKPKSRWWHYAVLVGGNTGIGKATAKDLAARGARILLLCRSVEKGGRAAAEIMKKLEPWSTVSPVVVVYHLDLASMSSIRECAQRIAKNESRIDVLINNAGVKMSPKNAKTQDGFDMQFGVNYLGHFLLTELLMPLLTRAAKSPHDNMSSARCVFPWKTFFFFVKKHHIKRFFFH